MCGALLVTLAFVGFDGLIMKPRCLSWINPSGSQGLQLSGSDDFNANDFNPILNFDVSRVAQKTNVMIDK